MGRDPPPTPKGIIARFLPSQGIWFVGGGGGGALCMEMRYFGRGYRGGGGASVVTAQAVHRAEVATLEMTQCRRVAYCYLLFPMASA